MKLRVLFNRKPVTGLIREFDDNYYDKIRVYKSQKVKDLSSASEYCVNLRGIPGLRIETIFFEDLELREEEHALPVEEPGSISDDLLLSYIRSSDIDIIKFTGEYQGKRIEIGISKQNWEVWLRIRQLSDDELVKLEEALGLR